MRPSATSVRSLKLLVYAALTEQGQAEVGWHGVWPYYPQRYHQAATPQVYQILPTEIWNINYFTRREAMLPTEISPRCNPTGISKLWHALVFQLP